MENNTRTLPMVALRNMTILPEMVVHFDVSRERSLAAIEHLAIFQVLQCAFLIIHVFK